MDRKLKYNGTVIVSQTDKKLNLNNYLQLYSGSTDYNGQDLPQFIEEKWEPLPPTEMCFGLFTSDHWLKVKFVANQPLLKSLYIDYVMIPEIDMFFVSNKNGNKKIFTGSTRNRSVLSQPITHGYTIDWPFEMGEVMECYIRIDGKGWSVQPIITLFDPISLFEENFYRSGYQLAFRLSVLIIFILAGNIYLLSKRISIVYYAVMMLSALIFFELELGTNYYFMDADPYYISYYLRYVANCLYLAFIFLFIKNTHESPKQDWLKAKIIMKYFALILVFFFTLLWFLNDVHRFIPSIASFVVIFITSLVFLYLILFLITKTYKRTPRAIFFLLIYFISVNTFLIIVFLPQLGWIRRMTYQYNIVSSAFFFEFLFFFVLTIVDTWKIFEERNNLIIKNEAKNNELAFALITGQEIERNRIGRELHDAIGGNLASAMHKMEDKKFVSTILNETLQLVRSLSHGLVTPKVTGRNFQEEINDLAIRFSNDHMKVHTIFHLWPEVAKDENIGHLFRISQELLQNASKHSQATEVYIQFLAGNSCQMTYEDNGIGFNKDKVTDGLGWKNIYFRAQALEAKIDIESSPLSGTNVVLSDIKLI